MLTVTCAVKINCALPDPCLMTGADGGGGFFGL